MEILSSSSITWSSISTISSQISTFRQLHRGPCFSLQRLTQRHLESKNQHPTEGFPHMGPLSWSMFGKKNEDPCPQQKQHKLKICASLLRGSIHEVTLTLVSCAVIKLGLILTASLIHGFQSERCAGTAPSCCLDMRICSLIQGICCVCAGWRRRWKHNQQTWSSEGCFAMQQPQKTSHHRRSWS